MQVVGIRDPVEDFLYFYGLFNSAASNSHYIASNSRMIDNYKLERILEEVVVS